MEGKKGRSYEKNGKKGRKKRMKGKKKKGCVNGREKKRKYE